MDKSGSSDGAVSSNALLNQHGISLIIPAYNEEDRIGPTIDAYLRVLDSFDHPSELVVVVDGNDGTETLVRSLRDKRIKCLAFDAKLGRCRAIFAGLRAARYSIVAYADADGSVPSEDAQAILRLSLKGDPVVIASRRIDSSAVLISEPVLRYWVGTVWHALVKGMLGLEVKDAQCGFKAFHRDVVEMLLREVAVCNRVFEVSMLLHVAQHRISIREIPVAYSHDLRTRMPITKAVPVMFLSLVGLTAVSRMRLAKYLPMSAMESLNQKWASV